MTKINTKTPAAQPQPEMVIEAAADLPPNEVEAVPADTEDDGETPSNDVEAFRAARADLVKTKLALIGGDDVEGSLKHCLFHAARLSKDSQGSDKAADMFREQAIARLLALRTTRVTDKQGNSIIALSGNEATAFLGDYFGFKLTPQGKPSKTLNPAGAAVSKRLVRLVKGWEMVDAFTRGHPEQAPEYFAKCDPADIDAVVSRVQAGASPYTAYDQLGEIAKQANDKAYWFNSIKRLENMTAEVATAPEHVLQSLRDNNMHKASLADLVDAIRLAIDY